MKSVKLGFIGAGNMAGAIIQGIVKRNTFPYENIFIFDINQKKCQALQQNIGVKVSNSTKNLVKDTDIIFLSVKPQNFTDVLTSIKEDITSDKLFVSIAAGISTLYIQQTLECPCPVIRTMPNTPLLLGKGATAMCRSSNVSDHSFELVKSFFEACGTVNILEEDKMNAVISVNGSSPAYIYLFAKAMMDSAIKQGIPEQTALELICQTLEGSAAMLRQPDTTPDQLIKMVSSPGGTTLEALDVFYHYQLEKIVKEAMIACTNRAEELGK